MSQKVFIIAEAGVNHNGDIDLAKKLIQVAVNAGADAIKFQTFKAGLLTTSQAPKADYQKKTSGSDQSQQDMLSALELSENDHIELIKYAGEKGILFLSTPFDHHSIDLLDKLGLEIFKIGSGDLTNIPYLRHIGGLGKRVILSTGMSVMDEVQVALNTLVEAGTSINKITLLHANTAYPTEYKDVNLLAMKTIANEFDVSVGYSDHTPGIEVPVAAVALGAEIIEKHVTLDRSMKGPDHKASLEPAELTEMVKAIRNVEKALGDGVKVPTESEKANITAARKSIVAAVNIKKGELFTKDNLAVKRPGNGLSPLNWDKVIGTRAKKNYSKDELI